MNSVKNYDRFNSLPHYVWYWKGKSITLVSHIKSYLFYKFILLTRLIINNCVMLLLVSKVLISLDFNWCVESLIFQWVYSCIIYLDNLY